MRKLRDLMKGREAREGSAAREEGGTPYERPKPPAGVMLIGSLAETGKGHRGGARFLHGHPSGRAELACSACEISDSTGTLTALFYGRSHIAGVISADRTSGCADPSASGTATPS